MMSEAVPQSRFFLAKLSRLTKRALPSTESWPITVRKQRQRALSAPRGCCPDPRSVMVKPGCRRFAFDAQFCRRRSPLRKDRRTLTAERSATLTSRPSRAHPGRDRKNSLAYVRAVNECGFLAVAGCADLLAHRGFHQFRPLRSFQCDRG